MKRTKTISVAGLDAKEFPSLEDILAVVNGGRYGRFFLKRVKVDAEGRRDGLTQEGARVYGRLVSILYAVARLTDHDMEDAVETLDGITAEEC